MSIGGKNINFNNLTQENNVEHNWLLNDKYKIARGNSMFLVKKDLKIKYDFEGSISNADLSLFNQTTNCLVL